MDFKVLLDASVLYPAYLRDLLLRLAEKRFFQPRWTSQILHEVSSNVKRRQPEDRHDRVDRMVARLSAAFPEAYITGHEDLIPSMTNHPKDRHVLAAAVKDNVDVIVTDNKKDFPLDSYKIGLTPLRLFFREELSAEFGVSFCRAFRGQVELLGQSLISPRHTAPIRRISGVMPVTQDRTL